MVGPMPTPRPVVLVVEDEPLILLDALSSQAAGYRAQFGR